MVPTLLGPMTLISLCSARRVICACRRAPLSSISEKPADSMTTALTPRATHSSRVGSTAWGGSTMMASSGGSGVAVILG